MIWVLPFNRFVNWSEKWQISIAVDKCFVCRIANRQPNLSPAFLYSVYNTHLEYVDDVRDLGITVDSNLKFDKHISLIVHKAHARSQLILKCFLSRNRILLTKAFCTYVRPLLEYCCTTWSPHLQYLIDKIERVQRYFTKRLQGLWRVCYTERLRILGLKSLEQRRLMFDLSLCYQIVYKLVDTSLANVLVVTSNHHTRGHPYKLCKKSFTTDWVKFFFTNRVVNAWNDLPESVVMSESIAAFKRRLNCYLSSFG